MNQSKNQRLIGIGSNNGEYSDQKCSFMPQPGNLLNLIYVYALLFVAFFDSVQLGMKID